MLATLPTWEGYPIANLSHAVTIFLYELHGHGCCNDKDMIRPCQTSFHLRSEQPASGKRSETSNNFRSSAWTRRATHQRRKTLNRMAARSAVSDDEMTRLLEAYLDATTALQRVSGDEAWSTSPPPPSPNQDED